MAAPSRPRVALRLALCFAFFAAARVYALDPPSVVLEDRLALGVRITRITLDTTHFDNAMLFVGTDTLQGKSYVLRVRTSPLAVQVRKVLLVR